MSFGVFSDKNIQQPEQKIFTVSAHALNVKEWSFCPEYIYIYIYVYANVLAK